jgi:hypothetical protein
MSFNYGNKIVTNGLVMYLDAANPNSYVSGSTTWRDISRGGNNGTLINGPTFNSANGGSIVFDGINDYVLFENIGIISPSLTFSFWVYPISGQGFVTYGNSGGFPLLLIQMLNLTSTTADLRIYVINQYTLYTGCLDLNRWNNITITRTNTTTGAVYKNGIFINTLAGTTGDDTSQTPLLEIGRSFGSLGRSNISQVQIYNRALSATEVLQNYNAIKGRYGL